VGKGRKDVGFNGRDPEGKEDEVKGGEKSRRGGRRWKSTKGERAVRSDEEKII
jgi:hypothetical protein